MSTIYCRKWETSLHCSQQAALGRAARGACLFYALNASLQLANFWKWNRETDLDAIEYKCKQSRLSISNYAQPTFIHHSLPAPFPHSPAILKDPPNLCWNSGVSTTVVVGDVCGFNHSSLHLLSRHVTNFPSWVLEEWPTLLLSAGSALCYGLSYRCHSLFCLRGSWPSAATPACPKGLTALRPLCSSWLANVYAKKACHMNQRTNIGATCFAQTFAAFLTSCI